MTNPSQHQTHVHAVNPETTVAPNYIVNTETGEIISPNELLPGVAVDMGGAIAPSLDDTRRLLDRYSVRMLVKKNRHLVIV